MKRRLNGEGSIYQRSDGYWFAAVSINGKQKVESCGKGDKGKEKALFMQEEMKKEAKRAIDYSTGLLPFSVYLGQFLKHKRDERSRRTREPIRESTMMSYIKVSANHIIPVIGMIPVIQLSKKDIQSVIDKMSEKDKAPSYIHQAYTVMRQAVLAAIPSMLEHDITAGVLLPPHKARSARAILTAEELLQFMAVVDKSRSKYRTVMYVYMDSGARISEILGLTWDTIGEDYIDINSTLSRTRNGLIDAPPKNNINRRVFLPKDTMALIHKQPRINKYVFPTTTGKATEDRLFRYQWNEWLKQAFGADEKGKPLVRVTPHSVRHMQALNLIRSKWDIADVEKRGGWTFGSKAIRQIYLAHSEETRQKKMVKDASKLRKPK